MPITIAVRPKKPLNMAATIGLAALLVLAYGWARQAAHWDPKRGWGLAFGVVAGAAYVFELAYPWRRRTRRLASAMTWAQAHLYLGALAFMAVLFHAGLTWPRGALGASLVSLSAWTFLTGLLGVALQKWVPSKIADGLRVEALFEKIPALVDRLAAEADRRVEGAGEVLARFYRQDLRPQLVRLEPSWAYLLDVRAGRERALEPLRRLSGFVSSEDRSRIEDLMSLYVEKLELDAHFSLQRLLRGWIVLHAPPAGVLMGLVTFHVWAWLWY